MANIKLSLSRLIPVTLLALLRYVVSKMTGNDHFATPAVPLADMTFFAPARNSFLPNSPTAAFAVADALITTLAREATASDNDAAAADFLFRLGDVR